MAHTGESYAGKAHEYAKMNEEKPIHVFYSRPALLSQLPETITGLHILDVGCGTGWFCEYLLSRGATVTAFDFDLDFVKMTAERVKNQATIRQADLSRPLEFAADQSVDLVLAPLVIHYVEDWSIPFAEFFRILKPGGQLLFSTHHPFNDWQLFEKEDYFLTEIIHDEWEIGPVSFYRRPLTAMCADLATAGFKIERIIEPQPLAGYEAVDPAGYQKLMRNPWFIVFKAIKMA